MNEFENWRPEAWLEYGVVVILPPLSVETIRPSRPRRSEKWPALALSAVLAFSTALGSTAVALDRRMPEAAAARKLSLGGSGGPVYMTPTGRFDVSPAYWAGLMAKMQRWHPVEPDSDVPYSEPFI